MVLTCIFFMDVTLGDLCMPGANAFCARVLCSRSHVDNAGMSENQTLGDAWPTTANLRSPVSSAQNAFQLVSTELSGCHSMVCCSYPFQPDFPLFPELLRGNPPRGDSTCGFVQKADKFQICCQFHHARIVPIFFNRNVATHTSHSSKDLGICFFSVPFHDI